MMDRHRDCLFIAGNNMGKVRVGFLSSSWSSQIVLVYRVACQNLPSSVSRAWSQLFVYKSVSVLGLRASREQTKAGVSCGVSSKMLMNRNNLPYLVGGESCRVSPFKSGRVMSRSQRKGNVRCMCNHEALACRVDMACNMYAFKKEPIFAVVVPTINRSSSQFGRDTVPFACVFCVRARKVCLVAVLSLLSSVVAGSAEIYVYMYRGRESRAQRAPTVRRDAQRATSGLRVSEFASIPL